MIHAGDVFGLDAGWQGENARVELNAPGDPTDFNSLTAIRLRDAYVWRVIDEEEIPKAWRDEWRRQGYELRMFPRLESTFILEKRARAAGAR